MNKRTAKDKNIDKTNQISYKFQGRKAKISILHDQLRPFERASMIPTLINKVRCYVRISQTISIT